MTSNHEDRLRRVLSEQASSVLPAADAWPKIRAGAERKHRTKRWLQYAGATAGATAAIVTVVLIANNRTGRVPDGAASNPTTPTISAAVTTNVAASTEPPEHTTPSARMTALPVLPDRIGPDFFAAVMHDESGDNLVLANKSNGLPGPYLTSEKQPGAVSAPSATVDGSFVYYLRHGATCQSGVYRVDPKPGPDALWAKPAMVIDMNQSIIAYALNGDGTRIAALRYDNCGKSNVATALVEYDATSGEQLRVLEVRSVPRTILTGLAWRPGRDELALIRSGQDGVADRVDLVDVSVGTKAFLEAVPVTLDACKSGGLKHVAFSEDSLYAGVDCQDRENASKHGQIFRAYLDTDKGPEKIASTVDGQALVGLFVGPARSGAIVYSTARWGGEDLAGPTTVYRMDVDDGRTSQVFERPAAALLLGLAW